jgi:hypothetical protein
MYSKGNISAVDESTVFRLMATIANDYATLLLYERTQDLFSRIVSHYPPHSEDYYNRSIGLRATHILAVLSFAEGNLAQVLYAYIHAKRGRIAIGSGEILRGVGTDGAPTSKAFRQSARTAKMKDGGKMSKSCW